MIDAETQETKAIREGKGKLVVGVGGMTEDTEIRKQLMKQMLQEDDELFHGQ